MNCECEEHQEVFKFCVLNQVHLVCQEESDGRHAPTRDLLLQLGELRLSPWTILLPSHHHPRCQPVPDDPEVLPVNGDESLLQLLPNHLGWKVGHKLAEEQLGRQSLHDKVGNLATGEAVKDSVETETVLLLLETEAAVLERVESVWNSTSVCLVNLVPT